MSTWASDLIRASFEASGARGPDYLGNFQLLCPFCEERVGKVDTKWKLSCNPTREHPTEKGTRGAYVCWRCDKRGWGGIEFLGEPPVRAGDDDLPDLGRPDGFVPFRGNEDSIALEPFRRYLRQRGVWEYAEAIGGGACLSGRYDDRVVIPHVVGGEWHGFAARQRTPRDDAPKYLYPRGMDRRNSLWGLEWVPPDDEPLWVVEGVFDALPLWPYGLATFGKSVTDEQVWRLARLGRRLVVALDGDAWTECHSLAMRLAIRRPAPERGSVRWAHLPPGSDPGTLGWDVKAYARDI